MTPTAKKQPRKPSKIAEWRKQIGAKVAHTRARTQARIDAFHRRQEAYSRLSDKPPVQEPPKRITWLTAIRILLAELGDAEYWRTLWHLLWRPGYVIADYLNGHRRNYLRPFELLIATTILLSIAVMIVPAERLKSESLEVLYTEAVEKTQEKSQENENALRVTLESNDTIQRAMHYFDRYRKWSEEHAAFSLLTQSILAIFFSWLLFRKSPRKGCPFVPDDTSGKHVTYNFPEILTTQIFIMSQLQLVNTVWVLVSGWFVPTLEFDPYAFPNVIAHLIVFVDYQQLFGRKWYSTLWRTFFCVIW